MSATIHDIAGNTQRAQMIVTMAVDQVQNTSRKIDELGNVAKEVGAVTSTIGEISEQTNLLALNATIEVARAAPSLCVNVLSKGLQVDDIKTMHNVISALRRKLEGDMYTEELASQHLAASRNL